MKKEYDNFYRESISHVNVEEKPHLLKKENKYLIMGSCFAENLFRYFHKNYIDCQFSPFGNIYNPVSLASSLNLLCGDKTILEKDIFIHRELWRHFAFDTEKCCTNKNLYLNEINNTLKQTQDYIKKADNLILTLGTSFVYRNINSGKIVNNCHKLPSSNFLRENMSIIEMHDSLSDAIKKVKLINSRIDIILTLSPVRHLRDSATDNSLSKARLRCLIDQLSTGHDIWYFPAYEIMLDQLRDYRWFGDDLAHPSDKAVEYIMERFTKAATDGNFQSYIQDMEVLNKSLNHRILHPETEESMKFKKSVEKRCKILREKYKSMNIPDREFTTC